MEYIKQNFSIKDLENLSGIKAHTIRIWEKRYNVLSPERTSTNIRTYDNSDLQKILNISFLNENGYKISRISKLDEEEINKMVRSITTSSSHQNRALNNLKIAMLDFNEDLFEKTYKELSATRSFREIFQEVFLPFLEQIGLLWQTDTIKPIHEHFIVDLIKQKVYLNLAQAKEEKKPEGEELYVLFLPQNEIHDIGILYLYYELLYHNKNTMYLGPSLPLSDLHYLIRIHDDVKFISYFSIAPVEVEDFIAEFQRELCQEKPRPLLLFGRRTQNIDASNLPQNVTVYKTIPAFIQTLI
ncbi:MAG: MerR family transcriptional regulator [Salegentibacter sp.]